jgi:1-acyl-sn-glycerol-3-phosphate acyltransferase
MFESLRATLRISLLLVITILSSILCLTIYWILPRKIWGKIVRIWAYTITKTSGINLETVGKTNNNYFLDNYMVVANHMSWLDVMLLDTIYSISFIAKAELRYWPLLNIIIKAGGTIFINRNRKRDIVPTNHKISKLLSNGGCIGLFPEGKVNNGKEIFPFKAPLLEAAIQSQSKIIPIVLLYFREDGQLAREALYYGHNLWQTVRNTVKATRLTVKAIVLPEVDAGHFKSRQALSEHLHLIMSTVFNERLDNIK